MTKKNRSALPFSTPATPPGGDVPVLVSLAIALVAASAATGDALALASALYSLVATLAGARSQ